MKSPAHHCYRRVAADLALAVGVGDVVDEACVTDDEDDNDDVVEPVSLTGVKVPKVPLARV